MKSKIFIISTLALLLVMASCSRKFMVVDTPAKLPAPKAIVSTPRVALVLGGGAFRGVAHVGVIKALEEAGIPIDLVVGTSAGSFAGALYADYPHIDSLIPLTSSATVKTVFDFSLFRSREGFISGKKLQKFLLENLHHSKIEDTPIPFVAVTTDLETGNSVVLASGPIAPAVNASCAIPGLFEPVKMYGTTFVDGGVLNAVPADVAKQYHADLIIAVDVMADFDTLTTFKNYIAVYQRSFSIAAHALKEEKLKQADIVIKPDLKNFPLMSSKDNQQMYEAGLSAGKAAIPEILKLMETKGIVPKVKNDK